jgi:hypothetical protein
MSIERLEEPLEGFHTVRINQHGDVVPCIEDAQVVAEVPESSEKAAGFVGRIQANSRAAELPR